MKILLKDGAPRKMGLVEISVSKNGNTLEIGAQGVEPAPVVLEFYDGRLKLRVYSQDGKEVDAAELPMKPFAPLDETAVAAILAKHSKAAVTTPPPPGDGPPPEPPTLPPTGPVGPAQEFDEAAFDAA